MKRRQGFTLIELLIVVAIIAILALIAVPNFLEAQVRAKVSRIKEDVRSTATAIEAYAVDYNTYPPCTGDPPTAPYVSRLMRLQPLTTPIAYITSVAPDVFNNKDQDEIESVPGAPGQGRMVPAWERRIINYWGTPYLDILSFSSSGETVFAEMPDELRKKGNWILSSFGPDQIYDAAAPWPSTVHIYDPTNGTISRGDIVRSKQRSYE